MPKGLRAAAACVAAAVVLAGCGEQSVTFTPSTTVPAVTIATTGGGTATSGTGTKTAPVPINRLVGPEGINFENNPVLAPAPATPSGLTIDGIQCQTLRQLAYQANTHLQVYVDGKPLGLPGGIGMLTPSLSQTKAGPTFTASTCYYWLHTLTQDGVIHVEAPIHRRFTLGQLFAIWGQPLSGSRVATASGPVTAVVDGRRFRADPRTIPLNQHTSIELAVGNRIPPFKATDWSTSGL